MIIFMALILILHIHAQLLLCVNLSVSQLKLTVNFKTCMKQFISFTSAHYKMSMCLLMNTFLMDI